MKTHFVYLFCFLANMGFSQAISLDARENKEFQKFSAAISQYSEVHPGVSCRETILENIDISEKCHFREAHQILVKKGYRLLWEHSNYSGVEMCQRFSANAPPPYPKCDTVSTNNSNGSSWEEQILLDMYKERYSNSCYSFGTKYICLSTALDTGSVNETSYYYVKK